MNEQNKILIEQLGFRALKKNAIENKWYIKSYYGFFRR